MVVVGVGALARGVEDALFDLAASLTPAQSLTTSESALTITLLTLTNPPPFIHFENVVYLII